MLREGYRVTAAHEASHWWFVSRRQLCLSQVRRAAEELEIPGRPLRILDYGCGTGYNLAFLRAFGEAVGAEVPVVALHEFRKAKGDGVLDLTHDRREHDGRFDIVTALDVLEHLDDDVAGLRRMRRFVRPGGQIILTVPAYRWLWSGEDVISEHRRRYTRG